MAFFGRYLEVVPNARLVWTNEESEGCAVTTVIFEASATARPRIATHRVQIGWPGATTAGSSSRWSNCAPVK